MKFYKRVATESPVNRFEQPKRDWQDSWNIVSQYGAPELPKVAPAPKPDKKIVFLHQLIVL